LATGRATPRTIGMHLLQKRQLQIIRTCMYVWCWRDVGQGVLRRVRCRHSRPCRHAVAWPWNEGLLGSGRTGGSIANLDGSTW